MLLVLKNVLITVTDLDLIWKLGSLKIVHIKLSYTLCHFSFLNTTLNFGVIPKSFKIKAQYRTRRDDNIFGNSMKSLVKDRLHFHPYKYINYSVRFLNRKNS